MSMHWIIWVCFGWFLLSHSTSLQSYRKVTITGEGLQNLTYSRHSCEFFSVQHLLFNPTFCMLTNVLTDFAHHEYLKFKLANSYTATEMGWEGVYMKGNLFLVSLQCIGIGSKMRNFRSVSYVHIFKIFSNMLLKFKTMANYGKKLHEETFFSRPSNNLYIEMTILLGILWRRKLCLLK